MIYVIVKNLKPNIKSVKNSKRLMFEEDLKALSMIL